MELFKISLKFGCKLHCVEEYLAKFLWFLQTRYFPHLHILAISDQIKN